jgi:hypothetical protein
VEPRDRSIASAIGGRQIDVPDIRTIAPHLRPQSHLGGAAFVQRRDSLEQSLCQLIDGLEPCFSLPNGGTALTRQVLTQVFPHPSA